MNRYSIAFVDSTGMTCYKFIKAPDKVGARLQVESKKPGCDVYEVEYCGKWEEF